MTAPGASPLTAGLALPVTLRVERSICPLVSEATMPSSVALDARFCGASKFWICWVRSWSLLRQGGLLAAELDQLVLGGRDGDIQDEYGHEGNGEQAEAKDHKRQAALAGCGADHRKRRATSGADPCAGRMPGRARAGGTLGNGVGCWTAACSCCSPGFDAFDGAQPGGSCAGVFGDFSGRGHLGAFGQGLQFGFVFFELDREAERGGRTSIRPGRSP